MLATGRRDSNTAKFSALGELRVLAKTMFKQIWTRVKVACRSRKKNASVRTSFSHSATVKFDRLNTDTLEITLS